MCRWVWIFNVNLRRGRVWWQGLVAGFGGRVWPRRAAGIKILRPVSYSLTGLLHQSPRSVFVRLFPCLHANSPSVMRVNRLSAFFSPAGVTPNISAISEYPRVRAICTGPPNTAIRSARLFVRRRQDRRLLIFICNTGDGMAFYLLWRSCYQIEGLFHEIS